MGALIDAIEDMFAVPTETLELIESTCNEYLDALRQFLCSIPTIQESLCYIDYDAVMRPIRVPRIRRKYGKRFYQCSSVAPEPLLMAAHKGNSTLAQRRCVNDDRWYMSLRSWHGLI